jgi:hypothetical protein
VPVEADDRSLRERSGMASDHGGCGRRLDPAVRSYVELNGLKEIVPEESYVLGVVARPAELIFDIEFVLTKQHPAYVAPTSTETECFKRGTLKFVRVERLVWEGQGAPPAIDASGERDFGHIDSFEWEDQLYVLAGDWGRIETTAGAAEVGLTSVA